MVSLNQSLPNQNHELQSIPIVNIHQDKLAEVMIVVMTMLMIVMMVVQWYFCYLVEVEIIMKVMTGIIIVVMVIVKMIYKNDEAGKIRISPNGKKIILYDTSIS